MNYLVNYLPFSDGGTYFPMLYNVNIIYYL